MDFQASARLHCLRAHQDKIASFATKVRYSGYTQGVSSQDPRIFQMDLGSLDLSYRKNVMEQMFGCWFANLVMWGPSLWSQPQGNWQIKNDLQESPF